MPWSSERRRSNRAFPYFRATAPARPVSRVPVMEKGAAAVPEAAPGEGRRRGARRIAGIDGARALAILGMVAVHVGPTNADGLLGRLYTLPHGRASILFVLIAGVGISLLASSAHRTLAETRLTLAWRAALLLPLGLALQELEHGAHVILQDYALLFVLAIALLALGSRWLLALAGASALLGPLIFVHGQVTAPATYARAGTALTDPPGEILHGLVLSGPYPLVTWAAPFLLGMWIGRQDLGSAHVRKALVVGGTAVAVAAMAASRLLSSALGVSGESVGYDHLVTAGPHSQMPLWIVGGTGVAALVLGLSLLALDRAEGPLRPLVAAGQLALTVYVGHLLALHWAPDALKSQELGAALWLLAGFTAVILVFAAGWRAAFKRGPLEWGLQLPWKPARLRADS